MYDFLVLNKRSLLLLKSKYGPDTWYMTFESIYGSTHMLLGSKIQDNFIVSISFV